MGDHSALNEKALGEYSRLRCASSMHHLLLVENAVDVGLSMVIEDA